MVVHGVSSSIVVRDKGRRQDEWLPNSVEHGSSSFFDIRSARRARTCDHVCRMGVELRQARWTVDLLLDFERVTDEPRSVKSR